MSEKQVHYLKAWPEYFGVILSGAKRFEIRKNDRGFSVGDELVLQEFTSQGGFTGREIDARITYLTDFEQKPGFVVLGIATRAPSPALDKLRELMPAVERILELDAKATQGRWKSKLNHAPYKCVFINEREEYSTLELKPEDADLIAEYRTLAPKLARALRIIEELYEN